MGDRARGKSQAPKLAEKGQAGTSIRRTRVPEPAGKGKGKADAVGPIQSPKPAGRGKGTGKAGTAGRTESPEPPGRGKAGRAVAASLDTEDQVQSTAAGRKRKGREAPGGTPSSQDPGKEKGRVAGTAGRTQSPEPGTKGRARAAAEDRGQSQTSGREEVKEKPKAAGAAGRAQSPERVKGRERAVPAAVLGGNPSQEPAGDRRRRKAAAVGATVDGAQSLEPATGSRRSSSAYTATTPPKSRAATERRLSRGSRRFGDLAERLREREEKTSLRRKECVTVIDELLRMIPQDSIFSSLQRCSTRWQISKENEFDIILKIPQLRVEHNNLACSEGDIFSVKHKRIPEARFLNTFIDESENLSSSMMLSKLREIIKEIIAKQKRIVAVERKRSGNPAIALLFKGYDPHITVNIILALEAKGSWPLSTKDGLHIEHWLGSKVKNDFKRKTFYFVPRPTKDTKEAWCLSFPHIEKIMLNSHGSTKTCCESNGPKCCRKACLRLLQYLLQKLQQKNEINQRLDKFSLYHAKTTLFHACVSRPCDTDWNHSDLDNCFEILVNDFVNCLQDARLPHFFIPSVNLFGPEDIKRSSLTFLSEEIEHQRNNDFPVFIH
ncbi:cyclic GMP-AMP synthase isoform X2 [Microcaecilia unicolor]|uniref:Cyclic GMP-AMP synthase-like isoform X2 n=1 Tax=Microcaecilia unicolor TaxID=1415580 RepID=A0A6P7XP40_9AMPH|nr:cyclic GMP-AMP synthase-like isoform X2 [Microcaecilia unicolor]